MERKAKLAENRTFREKETYFRMLHKREPGGPWLFNYRCHYPSFSSRSAWFQKEQTRLIRSLCRVCRKKRWSLGRVAEWLNVHGPRPRRGKKWRPSTVKFLVDSKEKNAPVRDFRRLASVVKNLRWAERNPQPHFEAIAISSRLTKSTVRQVWQLHALHLEVAVVISRHVRDRRRRGKEIGSHQLRVPSEKMPKDTFLLFSSFPDFLTLSVDEARQFEKHRPREALLRVLCKRAGISLRTVRRYKDTVQ